METRKRERKKPPSRQYINACLERLVSSLVAVPVGNYVRSESDCTLSGAYLVFKSLSIHER
eukprot:1526616-Pleurochrysis_carterae.AAC.4